MVYGARTDRRWLLAVGTFVALPVLWWGSLSLLIAVVALEREEIERRLMVAIGQLRRSVQAQRGSAVLSPRPRYQPASRYP